LGISKSEYGLNPDNAADRNGDLDSDGMTNFQEFRFGFDPSNPADAKLDADNDGYSNVEEVRAGSNPLSHLSVPATLDSWLWILLDKQSQ
jgi:hypothetical protein